MGCPARAGRHKVGRERTNIVEGTKTVRRSMDGGPYQQRERKYKKQASIKAGATAESRYFSSHSDPNCNTDKTND